MGPKSSQGEKAVDEDMLSDDARKLTGSILIMA